jgi:hypothetical protein
VRVGGNMHWLREFRGFYPKIPALKLAMGHLMRVGDPVKGGGEIGPTITGMSQCDSDGDFVSPTIHAQGAWRWGRAYGRARRAAGTRQR